MYLPADELSGIVAGRYHLASTEDGGFTYTRT
jgi:hypothetical protein